MESQQPGPSSSSSSSSSSSQGSGQGPVSGRRKRLLRQLSSDDSDDSSSGSPVRSNVRKRKTVLFSDSSSSSESEWQTEPESDKETPDSKVVTTPAKPAECLSDSSEGNSEKCPICLLSFSNQNIGTPESCEHLFCADCLTEWAKNVNTCPVDRMEFKNILVRRRVGGKVVKKIPVNPRRASEEDLFTEDPTFCEVCHSSTSEETMLLCDLCDAGYHMHCLNPPLTEVPENEWYCPDCASATLADEVDIYEGEIDLLWEEIIDLGRPTGPRPSVLRNPRVREQRRGLRNRRTGESGSFDDNRPSTSRQGNVDSEVLATSASTSRAAKPRRKRRRVRRPRNVVVEYEINNDGKFPIKRKTVKKVRRRRRKVKRQPRTAARRRLVKSSVRGRLAEQLNGVNNNNSNSSLARSIVTPQFSIFGNRDELEYFSDTDDEMPSFYSSGRGSAVAVAPRSVASAILDSRRQVRRKMISIPSPTYATSAPDILSSILESQSLFHSKNASISVVNGGALVVTPKKSSKIPGNKPDTAVDVQKPETPVNAKEAPMYPGGRGGGGNSGGNWRNNRDYNQGSGNYNRGNQSYDGGDNYHNSSGNGGGYQDSYDNSNNFHGNRSFGNNNPWHNNYDQDNHHNMNQRNPYGSYDRSSGPGNNRLNNRDRESQMRFGNNQGNFRQSQWHNRMGSEMNQPRLNQPGNLNNSDLGNPVDMTISNSANSSSATYDTIQPDLSQPPIIRFEKPPLSEDDEDASAPVEVYDPTEPTVGESSDEENANAPLNTQPELKIVSPPHVVDTFEENNESESEMVNFKDDSEYSFEVENNLPPPPIETDDNPPQNDDDDLESDCPNFSIYSSTSVDLLSTKEIVEQSTLYEDDDHPMEEDLVQEEAFPSSSDTNVDDTIENTSVSVETITSSPVKLATSATAPINIFKVDKKSFFGQKAEPAEKPKHPIKINLLKHTLPETNKGEKDDVESELAKLEGENNDDLEKFTESISDGEDERSYTPCLDENRSNKSKDTTIESEKDTPGIGGMDTEMISEDEGNELFSDVNRIDLSDKKEDTEIKKQKIKAKVKELLEQPEIVLSDEDKKKKKREKRSEKESNDRSKPNRSSKNDGDSSFKKLSKTGKERNYRDRDEKAKESRRSKSMDSGKGDKLRERKKEKRKDIERYDVRNVISEKSRRIKDAFGRDTSRPRSRSADSPFNSPSKSRRSGSRRRSTSLNRKTPSFGRSVSKNRSASPRRRTPSGDRISASRNKRSPSKGKKRSVSRPRRNRSPLRGRKSVSPRPRRGLSPGRRRSISPRVRRLQSPRKRTLSPRGRSPIRNRRSISPRNRRSRSRNRSLSRNRNRRIRSRTRSPRRLSPRFHRAKSPRLRIARRSRSKGRSVSRNRSRSRGRKIRKTKQNRSGSNNKRKSSKSPNKKPKHRKLRSPSGELVLSPSPSRDNVGRSQWRQGAKSPLYQDWSSESQSISPVRRSPGWTPPLEKNMEPQNLRVILTTKDKLKKRDKKKKGSKKNKGLDRISKNNANDVVPSKEVFTSGNNILVSVSFNKNQDSNHNQMSSSQDVVSKRKKRKGDLLTKQKKDKKDKTKKKKVEKGKKTRDVENKKPVAIIDLDRSPFKELTPSPKAVIVLSDSDSGEKEADLVQRQELLRGELRSIEFPIPPPVRATSPVGSPSRDAYAATTGPKTPPEPVVKFTITNKSNLQLRPVNPLHEEDDDQPEEAEEEKLAEPTDASHKGPNTPPDPPNSPPSSPDAYNPFEPTKSGSATPERSPSPMPPPLVLQLESEKLENVSEDIKPIQSITLEAAQKSNLSADDVIQARPISPMEKVMALLKSTGNNVSPNPILQTPFPDQTFDSLLAPEADLSSSLVASSQSPERSATGVTQAIVKPNSPKLVYSTVAPTIVSASSIFPNPTIPRVTAFTTTGNSPSLPRNTIQVTAQRIILPSPTKSSPLKAQQSKLFSTKPSPIKSTPIKPMPSKALLTKLAPPGVKPMPNKNNQKTAKLKNQSQNGQNDVIDMDMSMDSPYSPGSSDFGDLFEPPPELPTSNKISQPTYQKSNKQDMFDALFSAKPKKSLKVPVKPVQKSKASKSSNPAKIDEETLKIIDEMPSSAIDLQAKTRYLKKLHRQERIVEEVKIVLKPHFNKKRISKEIYKEIMRRAVPKICHSRSQEINPAKIHKFIEDYVKRFRKKALHIKSG